MIDLLPLMEVGKSKEKMNQSMERNEKGIKVKKRKNLSQKETRQDILVDLNLSK